MNRLRAFFSRLRGLVRGRRLDRDLQEEMDAHLEEATDEYLQQGLSHEEARRAALRSFGGVAQAQEVHRDLRSFPWLEDARRDIRYALRALQTDTWLRGRRDPDAGAGHWRGHGDLQRDRGGPPATRAVREA